MEKHGLESYDSGYEQVAGACECGYEPWGYIKCPEVLDWLRNCSFLKKDFAPWSWLVG